MQRVYQFLYDELRRLAQRHLGRERPGHTLQPTTLVHEAFVQLMSQRSTDWRNRGHFFAFAARLMRRILVDHARARLASKRGGGAAVLSLDELRPSGECKEPGASDECDAPNEPEHEDSHADEDASALDQALTRLATIDSRQAQIVEMRYFGGLRQLELPKFAPSSTVNDRLGINRELMARLRRESSNYPIGAQPSIETDSLGDTLQHWSEHLRHLCAEPPNSGSGL